MKKNHNQQRHNFSHLTQELSIPLQRVHKIMLENDPSIEQAIQQIEQMKAILNRLLTVQTITLFNEEYIHFCDLIICGSEMAQYFIAKPTPSKIFRQHALYWQQLVKEFKPFLKGVLNHYTQK